MWWCPSISQNAPPVSGFPIPSLKQYFMAAEHVQSMVAVLRCSHPGFVPPKVVGLFLFLLQQRFPSFKNKGKDFSKPADYSLWIQRATSIIIKKMYWWYYLSAFLCKCGKAIVLPVKDCSALGTALNQG